MGYLETMWIYCFPSTFNQWFYHPLILLAQISYYTGEDKMIRLRKFFHPFTIISCHSSIKKSFSSHQPPALLLSLSFFCVPSGTIFNLTCFNPLLFVIFFDAQIIPDLASGNLFQSRHDFTSLWAFPCLVV